MYAPRDKTQLSGYEEKIPELDRHESPLSPSQQRIWFLVQVNPSSPAFNLQLTFELKGIIDYDRLERAFQIVCDSHRLLKTVFLLRAGAPIAVHDSHLKIPFLKNESRSWEDLTEKVRVRSMDPFSLEKGPLVRGEFHTVNGVTAALVLYFHRIIFDEWSSGVFLKHLTQAYERPETTMHLGPQFFDYVAWHAAEMEQMDLTAHRLFWKDQLSGALPLLSLSTDRPRRSEAGYHGRAIHFSFSKELSGALKELSRTEDVTVFTTIMAGFKVLLNVFSDNQQDITVGTPYENRTHPDTEEMLGFFTTMLPIRTLLRHDSTFIEHLHIVSEKISEAFRFGDLPFEQILQIVNPVRDMNYMPLFQVILAFRNSPAQPLSMGQSTLRSMASDRGATEYDLSVFMWEDGDVLSGSMEYSVDLFSEATVSIIIETFKVLLQAAVESPHKKLGELRRLSAEGFNQYVVSFNQTLAPYPDAPIHELIAAQARRTPDSVACSDGTTTLTYRMLDDKSTRLAAYLQSKKCGPGSLVGICMSRTVEMVTALLAVLKTGAAYVPLDPSFPQDRLDFMVQDAAIATVLSDETAKSSVPRREVSVISVDGEREAIASSRYSFNPVIVPPDSAAYILYTSGSTGKPKGVCITHGSVVNFLTSMAIKPGFSDHDVVCGVTTLSFDIAVLELILPLTVGGRVEIMSRDIAADGNRLKKRLAAQDITVMQATPATWRLLIASGWQGNTTLKALCGGEALSPELAQALLERCGELWNMYGPTETTVWSSCARIVDTKECITLGNPIANTAFYIANESGMPLPPMAPGELLIGGKGLSTGYLNRPDLTHKNFLPNAIYPEHGPLMYRTGDLARLRPDGKLEYLRRIDTQVKVRGFRIELGEIETVAMRHPALKQCVAIVTGAGDDVRLVLYYVLNEGHTVTLTDLRKRLRADLPEYMIPQYVIRMEELPLTPNNKIDRKRLPPPADSSVAADDTYIAPRTKTEKIIAAVWSELLKTDHISIHSNFFELGGHSLLSMTCVDRINKETGFQINPRMILTDSLEQIASQCVNIDGLPVSHPAVEISNPENTIQPLYFGDSKSPLFGVYHPSLHSKNRDYGILICPPITHEYVRAHRSLRQLATALASKGFPVLRFDYFGVGDSAGESGEGGVARWTKDIRIAMEELMALSNKNSICLIGLRMGAALALQALSEKTSCKRLILWDPIISGLQMFKELADLHVTAYSTKVSKRSTELIGFPYPAQLQEELRGLDLLQARPTGLENVVLLVPGNGPQYSLLQQHLAQSTPSCTTMHFSDSTDWESPSAFDQMLIATNAIETIITVLTEEKQ